MSQQRPAVLAAPPKTWVAFRRLCTRHHGLTLVEVMLVISILGILGFIAMASFSSAREKADIVAAIADIKGLEQSIERFYALNRRLPVTLGEIPGADKLLDPWGNSYQYLNISIVKGKGKLRKDHNLVPINSDYDLYSMGKDGKSISPLNAEPSRDDIVRANNGAFIGLAADY